MNTFGKIMIGLVILFVFGWLILRTLNAEHTSDLKTDYIKLLETKDSLWKVKYDSVIYIVDTIYNGKKRGDSLLIVSDKKYKNLEQRLYETLHNRNRDSS